MERRSLHAPKNAGTESRKSFVDSLVDEGGANARTEQAVS
jgi:hypothetical protein